MKQGNSTRAGQYSWGTQVAMPRNANAIAGVKPESERCGETLPAAGLRIAAHVERLGLTSREWQVLELAADSLSNRAIARALGIAIGTVKLHLTHAYAKLRVTHRSQAVAVIHRLAMDDGREVDPDLSWGQWFPIDTQTERRRRGEVLFRRAQPGRRLYLLDNGVVEIEGVGRAIRAGAILGEIAVLTPVGVRTHTARCASDVELRYLTLEQARQCYFTRPDFGFRLLQLMTRRLMADGQRAPARSGMRAGDVG